MAVWMNCQVCGEQAYYQSPAGYWLCGQHRPDYDKRAQLIEALQAMQGYGDPAYAHRTAEDALLDYLGDVEIRLAFQAVAQRARKAGG